jgi:hypothetical protein
LSGVGGTGREADLVYLIVNQYGCRFKISVNDSIVQKKLKGQHLKQVRLVDEVTIELAGVEGCWKRA